MSVEQESRRAWGDMNRRLEIAHRLKGASPDELRVIECEVERLEAGREVYGAFDAATDDRDFGAEGWDELIDALLYARMEAVQAGARLQAAESELADARDGLRTAIHQREAMREYARQALEQALRLGANPSVLSAARQIDAADIIARALKTGLRVSSGEALEWDLFSAQMLRGTRWGSE